MPSIPMHPQEVSCYMNSFSLKNVTYLNKLKKIPNKFDHIDLFLNSGMHLNYLHDFPFQFLNLLIRV